MNISVLCLQVLNGIILQSLELFRKQEVDFLIATDVAARVSIRSKKLIFKILFSVALLFNLLNTVCFDHSRDLTSLVFKQL